ncbi:MAG: hypothetical protein KA004_05915 [Verrucomicrobiales bacterium]|nr:hypothetical protein [Verrucomicrobiales bacterium]
MSCPVPLRFLPGLLAALFLCGCAASTPQSRIAKRPEAFAAIPAKHKELAQRGSISEGMSKDAVWIAWGPANQILRGSVNGKSYDLWRYTGLRPVYQHSFGMGISFGHHHGHRGCGGWSAPYYDYDYGPVYVPFTAAEVRFRNDAVVSWERLAR